jgi:hypothetical protein
MNRGHVDWAGSCGVAEGGNGDGMWTKRRQITEATLQLGASVSRVGRRHDVKENRESGVPYPKAKTHMAEDSDALFDLPQE